MLIWSLVSVASWIIHRVAEEAETYDGKSKSSTLEGMFVVVVINSLAFCATVLIKVLT